MPVRSEQDDSYNAWVGLIFVFNLIVGTGALTLPAVFAKAGWVLGLIVIIVLAAISYVTVTFVIESMSCANAICHWKRLQILKRDRLSVTELDDDEATTHLLHRSSDAASDEQSSIEHTPLFSQSTQFYALTDKIELGEMATMFFNDFGRVLFYLCISIYLYGDLSIYSAAISKTLRDVLCSPLNSSLANATNDELNAELCWEHHTISRLDCYRLSLIAFICVLGPFTFFNVQKTKYIQMFTIVLRWLAFMLMITIAIHRLAVHGRQGDPPIANFMGLPAMFGTCVYSFMCHHSLPSLVSPIREKSSIQYLFTVDFVLISVFYLCLALTGSFAFTHLEDLYTLNFVPSADQHSTFLKVLEYFLLLFPVFTLSASFPIIAITLRNNLQTMFLDMNRFESYGFAVRRILFPLCAIAPPVFVTFSTDSVQSLVGFTGSYAGAGIQYLIPIFLVYSARNTCRQLLGQGIVNDYRSPFSSDMWLLFVFVWAIACVLFVTINFFVSVGGWTEIENWV